MRIVFIGGASRSGSTLLDRIFGSMEGFVSLGEVHHIWRRGILMNHPCGCGTSFRQCKYWIEILRRLGAVGDLERFARHAIHLQSSVVRTRRIPAMAIAGSNLGEAQAEYEGLLRDLYHAALEVFQGEVLVDSSKRAAHGFLLTRLDSDMSVLHLVRDSRAMAHSASRVKQKSDGGDGEMMATLSPVRSAQGWIQQNALTQALALGVDRSMRVRYEDLVSLPSETIASMGAKLALPVEWGWLDGRKANLVAAHTASGNPMRMANGPVRISLDDAWRREMPDSERRLVTTLTFPMLRAYGYR